jgi:threonine/homoserine/homoserine lactone efflux protein
MDPSPILVLIPLAVFAFVGSITPGPNNVLLAASGANFGIRRTVPHMLGITSGFSVLVAGVGLGLGALFEAMPVLHLVLRMTGAAYLLYLAWRIANATPSKADGQGRPFSLIEAAGFQVANPKAWVLAITAVSAFTRPGEAYYFDLAVVIAVFAVVNLPCIAVWTAFGAAIGRFLKSDRHSRAFNWTMAGLTMATAIYILF